MQVLKELDREHQPNHTLVIKATEDCSRQPEPLTLSADSSDIDRMTYHSALTRGKSSGYHPQQTSSQEWFNRYKHSRNLRSLLSDFANDDDDDDDDMATIDFTSGDYVDDVVVTTSTANYEEMPIFQSLISGALSEDGTLVQIVIHVQDINDNPPVFVSKIFTGGLTTAADFGTTIMNVQAIDADTGRNARILYYQIGEIHQTLTEGLEHLTKPPFLLDKITGAVLLNFDPQKGMKGYFDFMVLANDTDGMQDAAHVFIYLLREDQRVKFVLRQQPTQVRDRIMQFRQVLSNVTNAIVNVDDFKVHENRDGSVDKTKTDLYLHLVDRRDNSILEVTDVLRLIDQNIEILDGLFKVSVFFGNEDDV